MIAFDKTAWTVSLLAPLVGCMLAISPCRADDAKPVAHPVDRAREVALDAIADDLANEEIDALNIVSSAAVAARLCPGIALKDKAATDAIGTVADTNSADLSAEAKEHHKVTTLIAYGTLFGLALKDATQHEAEFCADARRYAGDADHAPLIELDKK